MTEQELTVSVIIASKNRHESLLRTIASVREQELTPLEIVVIDQSPSLPDAGLRSDVETGCDFPIHWIHRPELPGLTHARNVGFANASGELITFLDDDVVLDREYLRAVVAAFTSDVDGVGGLIVNEQEPQGWLNSFFNHGAFKDRRKIFQAAPVEAFVTNMLSGCNMTYRRTVYAAYRSDESLSGYSAAEDWVLGQRVSRKHRLILTPTARLQHLRVPQNRPPTDDVLQAQIQTILRCYREVYSPRERMHPMRLASLGMYRLGQSLFAVSYLKVSHPQLTSAVLIATWGKVR